MLNEYSYTLNAHNISYSNNSDVCTAHHYFLLLNLLLLASLPPFCTLSFSSTSTVVVHAPTSSLPSLERELATMPPVTVRLFIVASCSSSSAAAASSTAAAAAHSRSNDRSTSANRSFVASTSVRRRASILHRSGLRLYNSDMSGTNPSSGFGSAINDRMLSSNDGNDTAGLQEPAGGDFNVSRHIRPPESMLG